ncbi:aminotransferase-like domain-containing protein [Microlunatus soli]|uniref:DNA-binding transcriptional regulator, MocR family, contains an aminotransferase domain n=1 Tax=Microlunatus soli TaxID=630515 RepID=A0A1H1X5V7_9ACTN|nr:PLP-dependent aminotransferase family protein [Microlunatus soli]SDT04743.1 DNA-binding transcriptional regulator, MocR family, contains an aminotransferase domain [Microlunatus soli]
MEPIEIVDRLGRWSSGRGRLSALLAGRIRELIDDGELRPGEPLPTDRALAAALAVGRSTVVAAYEMLRADGRVVRRQGSGTQVAGERESEPPTGLLGDLPSPDTSAPIFLQHIEPQPGAIPLASAAPTAPPATLLDAQRRVLDRIDGDPTSDPAEIDFGYYPAGHPRLRSAIADYYRRLGVPTDPAQILVSNGSQQAISLLTRLLITPGDRVLVEAPTYPGALEVFRAGGADLVPLQVGMADLPASIAARPAALAYLVATHHNPTGRLLGALPGERLARAADVAGMWLIDDRSLGDLVFPGGRTPKPLAAHAERVITLGSLSKVVWGGLRVGWVRAPRPLINRLTRVRAVHDIGGSVLTQLAAADLVDDLDRLSAETGRRLKTSHDHLCAALADRLPDWEFEPAVGGQSLWVRLPYGDGDSFAQEAMRHGVAVLPGSGLDISGGGVDYLRLHFQLSPEVLTDAVRRLATAWQAYRPPVEPLVDRPKLAV